MSSLFRLESVPAPTAALDRFLVVTDVHYTDAMPALLSVVCRVLAFADA